MLTVENATLLVFDFIDGEQVNLSYSWNLDWVQLMMSSEYLFVFYEKFLTMFFIFICCTILKISA